MNRTIHLLFIVAALLSSGTAASAQNRPRAQAPQQTRVPAELVGMLVGGYTFFEEAEPEILAGRLPEHVSRAVVLPGKARPLASAVYPGHSLSVVAIPQAPRAAIEQLQRALVQRGWRPAPVAEEQGFVIRIPAGAVRLCREDHQTLSISATAAPGSGSYVRIFHSLDERLSSCRPESRPHSPLDDTPIPALIRPEGARMLDGGTSRSEDRAQTSVRLTTGLAPQALIAHYGAQLKEHGWTPGAQNSVDGSAMQTWSVTDARGRQWQGLLIATTTLEAGEREVILHASRATPRR